MSNEHPETESITQRMGPERKELYLALEKYAYSYFDPYLDEIHTSIIWAEDNDDLSKYHEILNACKEFEDKIRQFFAQNHITALKELGYDVSIRLNDQ